MKRAYILTFIGVSLLFWHWADNLWIDLRSVKRAEDLLSNIRSTVEKLDGGGRFCGLGTRSTHQNVITGLLDYGKTNGLLIGDKLLEIDNRSFAENRITKLTKYEPGDRISVLVERQQEEILLDATCVDETQRMHGYLSILDSISESRWQDCIANTYSYEEQIDGPSFQTVAMRADCDEAMRCDSFGCESPTDFEAQLKFEKGWQLVEEAVTSEVLNHDRNMVRTQMEWLEDNGFELLAGKLSAHLDLAEATLAMSGND